MRSAAWAPSVPWLASSTRVESFINNNTAKNPGTRLTADTGTLFQLYKEVNAKGDKQGEYQRYEIFLAVTAKDRQGGTTMKLGLCF